MERRNDRYSDLDVWVVSAPEDGSSVLAGCPKLAEQVRAAVLCQRVGLLPIYTHVTPEWERYDLGSARC